MSLTTLFPIIYGGLAVNLKETPLFPLGWVKYISPYRYINEALMYNEFDDSEKWGELGPKVLDKFGYDIGMWPSIIILGSLVVIF